MPTLVAVNSRPFRETLTSFLARERPNGHLACAQDFDATLARLPAKPWRMIFVDLDLPGIATLADVVRLATSAQDIPIVAVANGHAPIMQRRCRLCGLSGLVDQKDEEDSLGRTISMVMRGGIAFPETLAIPVSPASRPAPPLTAKQLQVFALIGEGKSNKQIAKDLDLSPNTVKAHVSGVLQRLEVRSRTEAIAMARQGWRP